MSILSFKRWQQWLERSLPENEEVDNTYFETILGDNQTAYASEISDSRESGIPRAEERHTRVEETKADAEDNDQYYIETTRGVKVTCRDLMLAPKPVNHSSISSEDGHVIDIRQADSNQLDLSLKKQEMAIDSPHVLDLNS